MNILNTRGQDTEKCICVNSANYGNKLNYLLSEQTQLVNSRFSSEKEVRVQALPSQEIPVFSFPNLSFLLSAFFSNSNDKIAVFHISGSPCAIQFPPEKKTYPRTIIETNIIERNLLNLMINVRKLMWLIPPLGEAARGRQNKNARNKNYNHARS